MAKRRRKSKLPVEMPNRDPQLVERDKAMFQDWYHGGLNMRQLSEKYQMTYDNVKLIASLYNWRALRRELLERNFSKMLDDMTAFSADIMTAFYDDFKSVMEDVKKEKRKLTADERTHLRTLWDRMLKEKRLEEGKPTEVSTGAVQVEVVVPPGSKVGVIPVPKSNITTTEKGPDEVPPPTINLDDIEEGHDDGQGS